MGSLVDTCLGLAPTSSSAVVLLSFEPVWVTFHPGRPVALGLAPFAVVPSALFGDRSLGTTVTFVIRGWAGACGASALRPLVAVRPFSAVHDLLSPSALVTTPCGSLVPGPRVTAAPCRSPDLSRAAACTSCSRWLVHRSGSRLHGWYWFNSWAWCPFIVRRPCLGMALFPAYVPGVGTNRGEHPRSLVTSGWPWPIESRPSAPELALSVRCSTSGPGVDPAGQRVSSSKARPACCRSLVCEFLSRRTVMLRRRPSD